MRSALSPNKSYCCATVCVYTHIHIVYDQVHQQFNITHIYTSCIDCNRFFFSVSGHDGGRSSCQMHSMLSEKESDTLSQWKTSAFAFTHIDNRIVGAVFNRLNTHLFVKLFRAVVLCVRDLVHMCVAARARVYVCISCGKRE